MSAERAVQVAIAAALQGNAPYMALIGSRLYDDEAEENAGFPYTVLGAMTENLDRTHDLDGYDHTITVHDYSLHRGKQECQQIREARNLVLHNARLTATGWGLIKMAYEFGEIMPEYDVDLNRWTRHGVSRYRVLSLEAP